MKNQQPEIKGLIFVLRGHFNPIIFSPVWFASEKLIRKEEAEKAETQIVHSDVVSFNLDWMRLQVTRDMFFVETIKEPYEEVLRDLILGTFKLLRHTPLKLMGIRNHNLITFPFLHSIFRLTLSYGKSKKLRNRITIPSSFSIFHRTNST